MFPVIHWFLVQLYNRHQRQQALYYATVHNVVSDSFAFDAQRPAHRAEAQYIKLFCQDLSRFVTDRCWKTVGLRRKLKPEPGAERRHRGRGEDSKSVVYRESQDQWL